MNNQSHSSNVHGSLRREDEDELREEIQNTKNDILDRNKERSRSRHGEDSSKRRSHHNQFSHREDEYNIHHNLDYYQQPSEQHRHINNYNLRETKVDLTPFSGKENIEDYLNRETKVEQIF